MNSTARRQIRDIQVRAETLISGRPTIEDIEAFDQYNEELKKYLLANLKEPELVQRATQIPRILNESNSLVATKGIITTMLAIFSPGLVMYFQQRSKIENSMDAIRETRGIYATIEFFTRSVE